MRADRAESREQRAEFTPAERRLIARLRTPLAVQQYLNALPYNTEPPPGRATLRSFRGVVRHHTAHCLEAALFAATVLEQHGYPPLVISFESIDELDHVIFVYQSQVQGPTAPARPRRWGSVARSRDPGLHGRKPVFATPRALAASYLDTYVDLTGRIEAFALVDLRVMGNYDWRLSERNVWKVERMLLDTKHQPLRMSDARFRDFRTRYRAFKAQHPDRKPLFYEGREKWTPIPEGVPRSLPAPKPRQGEGGYDESVAKKDPARLQSEREIVCPCCNAVLVIDLNLGRVISHSEPSSGLNIELSDAAAHSRRRESPPRRRVRAVLQHRAHERRCAVEAL